MAVQRAIPPARLKPKPDGAPGRHVPVNPRRCEVLIVAANVRDGQQIGGHLCKAGTTGPVDANIYEVLLIVQRNARRLRDVDHEAAPRVANRAETGPCAFHVRGKIAGDRRLLLRRAHAQVRANCFAPRGRHSAVVIVLEQSHRGQAVVRGGVRRMRRLHVNLRAVRDLDWQDYIADRI